MNRFLEAADALGLGEKSKRICAPWVHEKASRSLTKEQRRWVLQLWKDYSGDKYHAGPGAVPLPIRRWRQTPPPFAGQLDLQRELTRKVEQKLVGEWRNNPPDGYLEGDFVWKIRSESDALPVWRLATHRDIVRLEGWDEETVGANERED